MFKARDSQEFIEHMSNMVGGMSDEAVKNLSELSLSELRASYRWVETEQAELTPKAPRYLDVTIRSLGAEADQHYYIAEYSALYQPVTPWMLFGAAYGPFNTILACRAHKLKWHARNTLPDPRGPVVLWNIQWDEPGVVESGPYDTIDARVIKWLIRDAVKYTMDPEINDAPPDTEEAYAEGGDVYCGSCNSGDLQIESLLEYDGESDKPILVRCNECGKLNDVREALREVIGEGE